MKRQTKFITVLLIVLFTAAVGIACSKTHTVTFDSDGGGEVAAQTVTEGANAIEPKNPIKEGYDFSGWYLGDEAASYDFGTAVTGDFNLKAKWTPAKKILTVAFDTEGGTFVNPQKVVEGGKLVRPEWPVKTGYVFDNWYLSASGSEIWDFTDPVTSVMTLYAHWNVEATITVTFDTGRGSAVKPQRISVGNTAVEPVSPTLEGSVFTGWYDADGRLFDFAVKITDNLILTAKYEEIRAFVLTFDTAGGSAVKPQNLDENELPVRPEAPTKANFLFVDWYTEKDGGEAFDFDAALQKSVTVYARWREAEVTGYFEIVFDSMGGTAVKTQVVAKDDIAVQPVSPQKTGYEFSGWFNGADDTPFDFAKPVTAAVDLYAKWVKIFLVTYDYGYDGLTRVDKLYEGSKAENYSPQRTDYAFEGWQFGDEAYDFSAVVSDDILLTALWRETAAEENASIVYTLSNDKSYYSVSAGGTAKLSGRLIIAESYGGKPVKEILENGFADQSLLEAIVVPDTVRIVGRGAFNGCTGLNELRLPFMEGGAADDETGFNYYFGNSLPLDLNILYIGDADILAAGFLAPFHYLTQLTLPFLGGSVDLSSAEDGTKILGYYFGKTSGTNLSSVSQLLPGNKRAAAYFPKSLVKVTVLKANIFDKDSESGAATAVGFGWGAFSTVKLAEVNIPDETTRLEGYCFYNSEIASFTVPSSLTSVGVYCFGSCDNLVSAVWPEGAAVIPEGCFANCVTLSGFTIPQNISEIGADAFYNTNLSWAEIPASVTTLGVGTASKQYGVFGGCTSLETVYYGTNAPIPANMFAGCTSLDKVEFLGAPEVIGDSAFTGCGALTEIVLPEGLEVLGGSVFNNCTSLKRAVLPRSLTTLGEGKVSSAGVVTSSLFYKCDLREIDIPSSVAVIPGGAFAENHSLSIVVLREGLTTIGAAAFYNCLGLKSLTLPSTVTQIKVKAFGLDTTQKGNSSLSILELTGASVVTLENENAFPQDYRNLCSTIIAVPAALADDYKAASRWSKIADNIYGVSGLSGQGDTVIEGGVLARYNGQTPEYVLPASVTEIGPAAFNNNKYVEKIIVHAGVTAIGAAAFVGCDRLQTVEFLGDPPMLDDFWTGEVGSPTMRQAAIFPINESSVTVGSGSRNFVTIIIPAGKTELYKSVFYNYYRVSGDASNTDAYRDYRTMLTFTEKSDVVDGKYIVDAGGTLVRYLGRDRYLELPAVIGGVTIKDIGLKAFFACDTLESLVLPSSVASVGYKAFMYCTSLKKVNLEGVSRLGTADEGAGTGNVDYGYNFAFTALTDTRGVRVLAAGAFYKCAELTCVDLRGSGVTEVPKYCFAYCKALAEFLYDESLKSIMTQSFNSTNLKEVELKASLKYLDDFAFSSCSGLRVVKWNLTGTDDAPYLADKSYYFAGCNNVERFIFGEDVRLKISVKLLDFKLMKKLYLPQGVIIDNSGFFNAQSALADVYIAADENFVDANWNASFIGSAFKGAFHYSAARPLGF